MVPLSVLFAKPERGGLQVSPLGRWAAWWARDPRGVLQLWAAERAGGEETARQLTFVEDYDVCRLFFFSQDDQSILYLREYTYGKEFYHLYCLDLAPSAGSAWSTLRDVVPSERQSVAMGFIGGVQIWRPVATPREVVLAVGSGGLFWNLVRVHLDTRDQTVLEWNPMASYLGITAFAVRSLLAGASRLLGLGRAEAAPRVPAIQWFVAADGTPRGRIEVSLAPLAFAICVKRRDGAWHALEGNVVPFEDANMQLVGSAGGSGTLRMDFDGDEVSVHTSVDRDTSSFVRYHTETGVQLRVLAHDAAVDLDGFLTHPGTGAVQAVYVTRERTELRVLDDAIRPDLDRLTRQFQGKEVRIVSRTRADDVWVLLVSADTEPATYFWYDRREALLAFRTLPALQGVPLSAMQPVWIPARDGEMLLGYLSTPPGGGKGQALVVHPHGGPNARDEWGFNRVVQLLCSRGLAVLTVNYRGSTGFGKRFVHLGDGDVRGMMRDVEDAADWGATQGYARRAIVGGSWGGYCALYFAAIGPPVFDAAVSIVGLSCVGAANTTRAFRGDPLVQRYWSRILGDVQTDKAAAKAVSPYFHAENITMPVMLAHGDRDVRVLEAQSTAIADALRQRGTRGYYVRYPDEGHGIAKEPNVMDLWRRVERFLHVALDLPSRGAEAADPDCSAGSSSAVVSWNGLGVEL